MTVPIEILNKFPKLSNEKLMLNLSNPTGKNKLIIDTDTANEIDDQFALAWALLSEDKIDLLGVTAEPYSFQHHKEEHNDHAHTYAGQHAGLSWAGGRSLRTSV